MILKGPSWRSLSPGLPDLLPIDTHKSRELQEKVSISGNVYQVILADVPSNFYMIHDLAACQKYFIKHISRKYHPHYQNAEKIAIWLYNAGSPVNAAIDICDNVDPEVCYYVYPFFEGTRLKPTLETVVLLGQSLAELHQKLREYPDQAELIIKTQKRLALLDDIRDQIAHDKLTVGPIPDEVKKLAKISELNFMQGKNIQALHGDLNPGNFLIYSNIIHYFDFEDTLHSVLPTIYELVYLLERLIFIPFADQNTRVALGKAFIRAYLDHHGNYTYCELDNYALLALVLRSFCVLSLCELEGKKIHTSEWYKFKKLAELAKNTQATLKIILQA